MDVVVIDVKSLYVVPIIDNSTKNDILISYMQVSGEDSYNNQGERYSYWIVRHSDNVYSVSRKTIGDKIERRSAHLGLMLIEIDIADWWAQAYPFIEQTAAITGAVTGVALVASAPFVFVKWIRETIKHKKVKDEYKWVQSILGNDSWNISELSDKLSISEDQTKKLLKGFGYVWDSRKMLYISTDVTDKLRSIRAEIIPY
ncbi:MAG: hypothetical protein FWE29_07020 [Defluviitaleaceae bacterium]|nr:hypothetical protein [Defluviitaleaceae bacterium]